MLCLLSIIYSFFATPFYKSYVSIYPSNNDSNSISKSLSGIQGFASSFGYDLSIQRQMFLISRISLIVEN